MFNRFVNQSFNNSSFFVCMQKYIQTKIHVCMYVCMYFCLDCISFCLEDTRSDQKRKKAIVGCRIPTEMLFATLVLKGNMSPLLKNIICTIWREMRSKYISARLLCWKGSSHTCLIVWHVFDIICSL